MRWRIMAVLLMVIGALPAMSSAEAHTVEYFYINYCESCDPEGTFSEQFRNLTGLELSDCAYTGWNVVKSDGQSAYAAALAAHGLEKASLPLVIVDDTVYQGAAEINASLAKDALQWNVSTDSVLIYLYVPACESCAKAEAVLETLPESVELHRGDEVIKSPVVVRRLDASADPGYAQALFEAYDVPDARRISPTVFYSTGYLAGADAIERSLADAVGQGRAAGGLRYEAEGEGDRTDTSLFSIAKAVGAGLVAGFNPCALSMLLLFIAMVLDVDHNSALFVMCYLTAKLLCYLLIGFVLLGLFQKLNPHWLRPLARWIMTVLGGGLALLNLLDAWNAYRGKLANVRNQLPGRLRNALQRAIRSMTRGRVLLPASVALGFVVAGGEFLCAGQLYLMQLLDTSHRGGALPVLLYCLAFLTPSIVISTLILRGRSAARISLALGKNLAGVKLITGIAMLLLIILAWTL